MIPIQEHTYPLPDPDISIKDRNSYGYLDDEMLPLSRERAAELFEQDCQCTYFMKMIPRQWHLTMRILIITVGYSGFIVLTG